MNTIYNLSVCQPSFLFAQQFYFRNNYFSDSQQFTFPSFAKCQNTKIDHNIYVSMQACCSEREL